MLLTMDIVTFYPQTHVLTNHLMHPFLCQDIKESQT